MDWASLNNKPQGWWETGYGFAIQDDQAGIWVFTEANDTVWYDPSERDLMVLGTLVEVKGKIDSSSGVIRILPTGAADFFIVPGSTVTPVEPMVAGALSIPFTQGMLIKIPNVYYDNYLKDTKYGTFWLGVQ